MRLKDDNYSSHKSTNNSVIIVVVICFTILCISFMLFIYFMKSLERSHDEYVPSPDIGSSNSESSDGSLSFEEYMKNREAAATEYVNHPVDEPNNGYMFTHPRNECVAPFTVNSSIAGSCYVVLDAISLDSNTDSNTSYFEQMMNKHALGGRICFYVRAESVAEIKVPLGEYEVFYATGDTWYGKDHLFGPDTRYYKCDDTFSFTETSEGYNGWTISLTPVLNGNLDTDEISEADFPQ